MKIEDLDVLRPEARIVRIGGKDIDVSYVPCGITFEIDSITQELSKIDIEEVRKNGPDARKAFDLAIDLCAAFCSHRHPEMDRAWFLDNVDALQVQAFAAAIKEALMLSYAGTGGTTANPPTPKATT